MVTHISSKTDLTNLYKNDNQKLVVLEFMVSWSELCKFMEPAVNEFAKTYGERADFYMLDTDKFKEHAREKEVEALPTFLLLKNGKQCDRIVGVNKKVLEDSIRKNIDLPHIETPEDRNQQASPESKDEESNKPPPKWPDCIIL